MVNYHFEIFFINNNKIRNNYLSLFYADSVDLWTIT